MAYRLKTFRAIFKIIYDVRSDEPRVRLSHTLFTSPNLRDWRNPNLSILS